MLRADTATIRQGCAARAHWKKQNPGGASSSDAQLARNGHLNNRATSKLAIFRASSSFMCCALAEREPVNSDSHKPYQILR